MKTPSKSLQRFPHLDGLRGWAALVVLINHVFPNFLYYSEKFDSISDMLKMPSVSISYTENILKSFISVIYLFVSDGALAVCIFFILSGFVLSISFFYTEDKKQIIDQLLRRYLRLSIPILASVLIAYLLMVSGQMYNGAAAPIVKSNWIGKFYDFSPNFWDVFKFSGYDVYFQYDETKSYNFAAWTMGTELFGSIYVFSALLATRRKFLPFIYGISIIIFAKFWTFGLCFVIGMIVADLYSREKLYSKITTLIHPLWFLSFSLIPFSSLISTKISNPQFHTFFDIIISAIILLGVLIIPTLKNGMSSKISCFLGRISFPLYLIHPVILCSAVSFLSIYAVQEYGSTGKFFTTLFALIVSLFSGWCLLPVEKFSILASRKFSNLLLERLFKPDFRFISR